jgi:hypothetical protein
MMPRTSAKRGCPFAAPRTGLCDGQWGGRIPTYFGQAANRRPMGELTRHSWLAKGMRGYMKAACYVAARSWMFISPDWICNIDARSRL